MPDDNFTLLTGCDDRLSAASVVDQIPFYRFISVNISSENGKTYDAVFPTDHAMPELVKEEALGGWPPDDIVAARGGLPLVSDWDEPPEESRVDGLVHITVDDLDKLLADPRATVGGNLSSANVEALLSTGSTIVRREEGPPVLVEAPLSAMAPQIISDGEVVVNDLPSLLDPEHKLLPISATNVRELRSRGSTWVRLPSSRGGGEVRIVTANHAMIGANGSPRSLPLDVRGPGARVVERPDYSQLQLRQPLPQFKFVLYLAYRQEWELRGYARGDLLSSIALAPQEETTIEVFTWDRQRQATDTTEEAGWESSLEAGTSGKLTRDLTNEVTKNEAWKLTSAGVQVGVPGKVNVGANMGGEFGNTLNTVNKQTVSWVAESTVKAASKVRGMRQTKVSETHERGFEERSTRKLRNPNLGYSISYDLFEVLASYKVRTRTVPEQTRLGVLVPNPLPLRFDRLTILAFEGALRRALLDSNQKVGFESARWLAARDEHCAILKEPPCVPEEEEAKPTSDLPAVGNQSVGGAAGYTGQAAGVSPVAAQATRVVGAGKRVAEAVRKIVQADYRSVATQSDAGKTGAALEPYVLEYRQWLLRVFGFGKFQPGFWGACQRFEADWETNTSPERVEQLLNETSAAWAEALGRVYIAYLIWPLAVTVISAEVGWHLQEKTLWYGQFTVQGFDDAGLGATLAQARTEVDAWRKALQTQAAPPDPAQTPPAAATDAQKAAEEKKQDQKPFPDDDIARCRVAERALLTHLEQNRNHYLEALWASFEPADRARILEAACGKLGEQVEPELLGFFGDRIAVPFRVDSYPQLKERIEKLIEHIADEPPESSKDVVLPTPGLHIQNRIGECDACEPFVATHREHDLAEKQAKVRQEKASARHAELENERLKARLEVEPPLLEDPDADGTGLTVRLVDGDEPQPDE